MNPFKVKKLDDFTIEDCEVYLSRYPYGEHSVEVNNRMKGLKKGATKTINNDVKSHNSVQNALVGDDVQINNEHSSVSGEVNNEANNSKNRDNIDNISQLQHNTDGAEKKSIVDRILWWVGAIVVTIIVGTIIIYLLDLLLPDGTFKYITNHRWIVYGICLLLQKWINEK